MFIQLAASIHRMLPHLQECSDHPGFITTFRAGAAGTNHAELSFEDFRHVCHKWQFRMTKAVIACFESTNYTQIRNALIVLTKVEWLTVVVLFCLCSILKVLLWSTMRLVCLRQSDRRSLSLVWRLT